MGIEEIQHKHLPFMGIEEIQHLLTNGIGVPSKVQFSNYIHERSSTHEVHEEVESKMYLQFCNSSFHYIPLKSFRKPSTSDGSSTLMHVAFSSCIQC